MNFIYKFSPAGLVAEIFYFHKQNALLKCNYFMNVKPQESFFSLTYLYINFNRKILDRLAWIHVDLVLIEAQFSHQLLLVGQGEVNS